MQPTPCFLGINVRAMTDSLVNRFPFDATNTPLGTRTADGLEQPFKAGKLVQLSRPNINIEQLQRPPRNIGERLRPYPKRTVTD